MDYPASGCPRRNCWAWKRKATGMNLFTKSGGCAYIYLWVVSTLQGCCSIPSQQQQKSRNASWMWVCWCLERFSFVDRSVCQKFMNVRRSLAKEVNWLQKAKAGQGRGLHVYIYLWRHSPSRANFTHSPDTLFTNWVILPRGLLIWQY